MFANIETTIVLVGSVTITLKNSQHSEEEIRAVLRQEKNKIDYQINQLVEEHETGLVAKSYWFWKRCILLNSSCEARV